MMKPVNVTAVPENDTYIKTKAINRLMIEVQRGWDSAKRDGWISEEDAHLLLEVDE